MITFKNINAIGTEQKAETRVFFFFPTMVFLVLSIFEILYTDTYKCYQRVKKYFPFVDKEYTGMQLKECVFFIISVIATVIYFFLVECNKDWLYGIFKGV